MFRSKQPLFSVTIARGALDSIYDECDQYESHETGGRLIGTYQKKGTHIDIQVLGVLGPGPKAQRSAVSFFQDGDYQEKVFRSIEEAHPDIEHLGNWHTHHVNGLAVLSQGDHTTYHKIVNHEKHNTDFFYALLVVKKNHRGQDPRYEIKHYFFRRKDDEVYELPASRVRTVDTPILWPRPADGHKSASGSSHQPRAQSTPNVERVKDQEFFSEFYPSLKALFSKSAGALYWKGAVGLIDGSHAEVLAMENSADSTPFYSISTGRHEPPFAEVLAEYKERQFRSARHAILSLQADLNKAAYRHKKEQAL
jgi:hypothetical protein